MLKSNLRKENALSEWTITADDANHRIARAIRICVGNHLREMYGETPKEPIPPKIAGLLRRLHNAEHYFAEEKFCAELAESANRPDHKDRWLKIAQEWRDLANQARRGGKVTQH